MSGESEGGLNRFVVALMAMVVIFGALLAVLLAWAAPDGSIGRVQDFAGFLDDHNDRDGKLILSLGALVVVLLMTCVLILELAPSSTQRMRVRNVTSGEVTITTKRIAELVDDSVRAAPHVADCSTTVARRGRRVELVLDLHVDAGAELAQTADEACRRAHVLVEQLGIELSGKPRARLHYRELRLRPEAGADADARGWERPPGQGAT
ncbi:MAG TPA: hypothetical protein VJP07_07505 [Dehalococcoidia bacterium]|nr:hypothetical protein [Dehalococcoidia bacterium]